MRLRRRRNCTFRIRDEYVLDFERFFRGEMSLRTELRCELLCPLTGEAIAFDADDVPLLARVSVHAWTALEEIAAGDASIRPRLLELARRGVLMSDPPSEGWPRLAEQEAGMDAAWWDDLAGVFHAHTRWRGIDSTVQRPGDEQGGESLTAMIRKRGMPPTHFPHRSRGPDRIVLDMPDLRDDWLARLRLRCTTRAFRTDVALPRRSLEYALHAVFGVQGIRRITDEISAIRRTSPSAGAMHPLDAFVLVLNVESVCPGLYHYEADSHGLVLLEALDAAQARELARLFLANQAYFADAHALLIQVARFDRNFWKYPGHKKAYKAVLLDAGHLSQTLYIVATHLGLGAFFTSAINDGDIADRLGLDPLREAAVGINGLGIPDADDDRLQFKTEDFVVDRRS